jgi:hypothetical protein
MKVMPRVFAHINRSLDSVSFNQTDVCYHCTDTTNVIENVNDNA